MVAFRTVGENDDDSKSCGWGIRAAVDIKAGTYLCDYFGALRYEYTFASWDKNKFYESDTAAKLNFIEIAELNKHQDSKEDDEGCAGCDDFSETRILLHRHQGGVILSSNKEHMVHNPVMRQYARPIVDAKEEGNIGRFFNHACQPNIFIQNVFTEHQDMRFPHTSFFTMRNIKAGEELRWNYGYEIQKTAQCYCGSSQCKGWYK